MKNRIFVTMLVAAGLMLPASAQQSSSNASTQPATHETATGKEPLQTRSHDFWDGDEPGLGSLIFHPFASKKYVQRHLQATQDRVNELDELTATNAKMIRDIDSRSQQGIQLASAKVKEADDHATDSANKAELAHQTATTVNNRVAIVEASVTNVNQYKAANQTEIRFRPGQTVLSKQAKDAIDELATNLKDQRGYIIEVQGFSTGRGQTAIANSRKIADSVVRYLVLNHEIPSYRIYVLGMGNAPVNAGDGATTKRATGTRVEISVLKNDLEQTAKQ